MDEYVQSHFVLIPLMGPGHLIPMVDLARLVAQHGVLATIITTPLNATRFDAIIERDIESGLPIRLLRVAFPSCEVGLPQGCENVDSLPRDVESSMKFFKAAKMLQQPVEKYFEETKPKPSCIISDKYLPWTVNISQKFQIPRLHFDGMSCFTQLCNHFVKISRIYEKVADNKPFIVPGLPDRIELVKAQLPSEFSTSPAKVPGLQEEIYVAAMASYGVVINTFEELESAYVQEFRKVKEDKVWVVGPVSLRNTDLSDKSRRGNRSSIDENECLKWLDSWPPSSVVYASFGTLNQFSAQQLIQVGLGLEETNRPFIWVIKGAEGVTDELNKLISAEGFEERIKGRGILIRGWAPQLMILSHQTIGGFLTHCGWNSVLEGVSAGVPMITWPYFSDQFYNEKLVVQVLEIGESIGSEVCMQWGEEDKYGVVVKKDQVKKVVDMVMDKGKEGEERRERVKKLAEMARKSVQVGGSSYQNIDLLIKDVIKQALTK